MTDEPEVPLRERYARLICETRGADPDAPITIVSPEGEQVWFDPAWEGYADLADELLALHDAAAPEV